jgi:hypothetical protein
MFSTITDGILTTALTTTVGETHTLDTVQIGIVQTAGILEIGIILLLFITIVWRYLKITNLEFT